MKTRKERIMIRIFSVLLSLLAIVMIVRINIDHYRDQTELRLQNLLVEVESYYKNYKKNENELNYFQGNIQHFYAGYLSDILLPVTEEKLNTIARILPENNIYYINNNKIISNEGAPKLIDYESILEELEGNDYIGRDNIIYSGMPVGTGWFLISENRHVEKMMELFFIPSVSENIICWDENSGKIILSSDGRFQDMPIYDFLKTETIYDESIKASQMRLGYNDQIGYFDFEQKKLDDAFILVAYSDYNGKSFEFLRSISMEIFLIPLVILLMVHYAILLVGDDRKVDKNAANLKKGHLFILNRNMFYRMTAFYIVGVLISLSMTMYVHLLAGLSDQNVRAISNLEGMAERIQKSEEISESFEVYFDENVKQIADLITWGIQHDSVNQLDTKKLRWIEKMLELQEVAVFNEAGEVIASSTNNIGYRLKQDISSADHDCRDILIGKVNDAFHQLPDHNEYYALRRRDSGGFIRLTYDISLKEDLKSLESFEKAFLSCDFGEAYKIYVNAEDNRTLYLQDPKTMTIKSISYDVPENILKGNFNGIRSILGKMFYVNSRFCDGKILIHAILLRYVIYPAFVGIGIELMIFTLFYLYLTYRVACSRKKKNVDSEEKAGNLSDADQNEELGIVAGKYIRNISEKMMEQSLRKLIGILIYAVLGVVLLLMILDAIFAPSSLVSYLLSNKWESGFNLFSFTKILLALISTWIFSVALQNMILMITESMDTRGTTIGHMLVSIIQFGKVVFIIIYGLVQIGFNMNSLLAGAGIAGAALAIAGQSVVNDLLSGLFIVFEGKFGVGDWVTIGDWRGQVQEIGVRTTTIAIGDDIKIFNNSSLNGIVVWSHAMCGAICYVDIAYKEDVEKVIKLIQGNIARYKMAAPQIQEGLMVHGVTNLGENGVTLRISAYVEDQRYVGRVQRAILQETKHLFDENGITIPFPQVVVHNEMNSENIKKTRSKKNG